MTETGKGRGRSRELMERDEGMRALFESGALMRDIAGRFGVCEALVSRRLREIYAAPKGQQLRRESLGLNLTEIVREGAAAGATASEIGALTGRTRQWALGRMRRAGSFEDGREVLKRRVRERDESLLKRAEDGESQALLAEEAGLSLSGLRAALSRARAARMRGE